MTIEQPAGEAPRERIIAYAYRLRPSRQNRLLQLYVDQPTRGLDIELDYSDTDIAYVNMIDFVASSQKGLTMRSPDRGCCTDR
ncbi:hypothetical protein ACFYTQ_26055 [Nocardia sp. NPDC004068]|uniref:hypothetical protein n=1 Tax=Nocardia sp. NPDC004068 TaxID=3364303 RepID=UPI0036C0C2AB